MKFDFAIVDCLVEQDGKFLLIAEGKPGRDGLYNLPGGHIDDFETITEACIREVKEESGYDIEITGFLGIYQAVYMDKQLNVGGPVLLGKVTGGETIATVEHPEVRWVTADELFDLAANGKIWTTYPPKAVKRYLADGAYPISVIDSIRFE